ncbi:hypothetical protein BHM03_00019607 [Ensete ventricosum]|nr:hypothetical protein BHM03_00019607 [Ensete ventricosum]
MGVERVRRPGQWGRREALDVVSLKGTSSSDSFRRLAAHGNRNGAQNTVAATVVGPRGVRPGRAANGVRLPGMTPEAIRRWNGGSNQAMDGVRSAGVL